MLHFTGFTALLAGHRRQVIPFRATTAEALKLVRVPVLAIRLVVLGVGVTALMATIAH